MAARLRIGTSGFTYDHWREVFYPPDVKKASWLEFYAEHFDTVEINSSFYHMPRESVCRGWAQRVGDDFCFTLKLNRMITHRHRLADSEELLAAFLTSARQLGEKLGPILVQLPPRFRADPERLGQFLDTCPASHLWAVEFRDPSWLCEPVLAVLRDHNAALVVHDLIENHRHEVTADFAYLRFHGTGGHDGCYSSKQLRQTAERVEEHLSAGVDVFVYFNNDVHGHAVRNATELKGYVRA